MRKRFQQSVIGYLIQILMSNVLIWLPTILMTFGSYWLTNFFGLTWFVKKLAFVLDDNFVLLFFIINLNERNYSSVIYQKSSQSYNNHYCEFHLWQKWLCKKQRLVSSQFFIQPTAWSITVCWNICIFVHITHIDGILK